jgi:probable rRNA maturation factor
LNQILEDMISIAIKKQPEYSVNKEKLKKELTSSLKQSGLVSNAKVSIAIVDEKEMLDLSKKYLKDNSLHNVLSFPEKEVKGKFISPPGKTKYLGEIIICYPMAEKEAKIEDKTIEEKIIELAKHGGQHLMGIHHD